MRPRTIAEISDRAQSAPNSFDRSTREFLDAWQMMPDAERFPALSREPGKINPRQDAYLAALAEHLALESRLPIPSWTERTDRFLSEPYFAGNLQSLKALLLVESPLAFRRRLIFISADALSRPIRDDATSNTAFRAKFSL